MSMIDTRSVFVDGIPGSGKSTLTNHIGGVLKERGTPFIVYDEGFPDHPLRIYKPMYTDFTLKGQSAEFRRRSLRLYRAFVKRELSQDRINIFDGWLFQATIGFTFLLRMNYMDSTDFALELMDCITPLSPVIIFLAIGDVEGNWRRTCAIRGQEFTEGRCGIKEDRDYVKADVLWSSNQAFCLAILRQSNLRHLVLMNTDNDYETQRSKVEAYLGI